MLGTSVHSFLEELSRLRATLDWDAARAALPQCEPRIAAQVRASGFDPALASQIAAQALQLALKAANDPQAQWILSPHADAGSEVRWAGVVAGRLTTVRVDRVFRAGPEPLESGDGVWWIVDYKTAFTPGSDPDAAVSALRSVFAPQLEVYARVLRQMHGNATTIRAGLYYPRWTRLDWWKIPASAAEF